MHADPYTNNLVISIVKKLKQVNAELNLQCNIGWRSWKICLNSDDSGLQTTLKPVGNDLALSIGKLSQYRETIQSKLLANIPQFLRAFIKRTSSSSIKQTLGKISRMFA